MDKIKQLIIEEAHTLRVLCTDGLRSGAYTYPFRGILYFLYHRHLQHPFFSKIGATASLSLVVTSTMFFFTYLPQAALLALTNGPLLAPVSAAFLVLSESSTLTNFLAKGTLFEETLIDTFDATLLECGNEKLVAEGRQMKSLSRSGGTPGRLGTLVKKGSGSLVEKMSISNLVRSFLYLPLNFIPVVGTLMYIVSQGKRVGPLSHSRYYQLKGWDSKKRDGWIKKNEAAYVSFGAVAFLLETVPFASLAFAYTNTVGGALWASNLEKTILSTTDSRERKQG